MGVTRWIFIACIAMFSFYFVVEVWMTIDLIIRIINSSPRFTDPVEWIFRVITQELYYIPMFVLSIIILRDLRTNENSQRYRIRSVGLRFIGLLSLVMFAQGFETVRHYYDLWHGQLSPHFSTTTLKRQIAFIADAGSVVAMYFWLGALCLYARYRIAANKRLAAASDHKP